MSWGDHVFPCGSCICEHCANNVETADRCTGEAKRFCFYCDECMYYDGKPSNGNMKRWECEDFIVTEEHAKRRRKRIRLVKK